MKPNLKLSLAKYIEVKPYIIKDLKIYSFEEAIYIFYNNWREYSNDFFEEAFITWVNSSLLDFELANKLKEIREQHSFYQKSIEFLTINNFYSLEEIEKISLDLFNWEKRGQIERLKFLGDKFFNEDYFEKAIKMYRNALDFEINNPILYNNIGICYIRTKNYEKAYEYLEKAYEMDLSNQQILFNLIEVCILKSDYNLCISFIQKINCKDEIDKVYYYLGEMEFAKSNFNAAISNFSKCYIIKKEESSIIKIAEIYSKIGKFDKAFTSLSLVGETDLDILIQKSNIYEKINNVPMAIRCIEKANFYDRNNFKLWLRLAGLYRKEYDISKSEGAIHKAYSLQPDNPQVIFEKALIKKAQGKFKEYQALISKLTKNIGKKYRENSF